MSRLRDEDWFEPEASGVRWLVFSLDAWRLGGSARAFESLVCASWAEHSADSVRKLGAMTSPS